MARRGPIAVLGAGAVGRTLARELAQAGAHVVLWARNPSDARHAARRVGPAARARIRVSTEPCAAVAGASAVLLCLPEDALRELLARLRPALLARPRPVLLTVSGVVDLRRLRAAARGAPLGRFHPLLPVLAGSDERTFEGMPIGLEGPPAARREARRLGRLLGGVELALSGKDPAGYHAGAALLGGGLVALLHLAELALAPSVRSSGARRDALTRFAARNVANVRRAGPAAALTGPIARGARANVRANLRALGRVPGGRDAYRALGRVLLALARTRRGGARARLDELARLLDG